MKTHTISQLINELQKIQDKEGNIPIMLDQKPLFFVMTLDANILTRGKKNCLTDMDGNVLNFERYIDLA